MFELDVRSRKPIYEQLQDKIRDMIVFGALQAHKQLPSVRTLSSQLTVNPNTIQKAYRELERQGYIYSVQGKGSFVAPPEHHPQEADREKLRGELLRLMTEAVYLGWTKKDIEDLYIEAVKQQERGMSHD